LCTFGHVRLIKPQQSCSQPEMQGFDDLVYLQIATIGLAAATDVVGVTLGGMLGHAMCTGAAVLGGRHLSKYVSEKAVGILGGVLFLLFAFHAIWTGE